MPHKNALINPASIKKMTYKSLINICLSLSLTLATATVYASTENPEHKAGPACEGFGPQTPRDIDSTVGNNQQVFP